MGIESCLGVSRHTHGLNEGIEHVSVQFEAYNDWYNGEDECREDHHKMDVLEAARLPPVVVLEGPEYGTEDHGEVEYPPKSYLGADVDPCCS